MITPHALKGVGGGIREGENVVDWGEKKILTSD